MLGTPLILDTNVLLHYRFFDQIKWPSFFNADVTLVITPVVLRELDKRKATDPSSRVRQRAASVLRRLSGFLLSDLKPDLGAKLDLYGYPHEPTKVFASHQTLDVTLADDRLIATALEIGSSAVLVTADLGAALKARSHGVRVFMMPEDLREGDEPDLRERELRELQRQVQSLKNASPHLVLTFADGASHRRVVFPKAKRFSSEEIGRRLNKLKGECPYAEVSDLTALGIYDIGGISRTAADRYNRELDEHFQSYEDFLLEYHTLAADRLAAIRLDFAIRTDGATADDVGIDVTLPACCYLVSHRLPKKPSVPVRPVYPRRLLDLPILDSDAIARLNRNLHEPSDSTPIAGPDISVNPERSWLAQYRVQRIKPGRPIALPPLFVCLREPLSFTLAIEINAANLLKVVFADLHLSMASGESLSGT